MNKFYVIIGLLLLIMACGTIESPPTPNPTPTPQSCTVKGNVLTCPDGSSLEIPASTDPVTTVSFCSSSGNNVVTNYPVTFPEYGICIDSILYAVYWDGKSAWLAEIVPGYYASTSTSAPCNFTVLADCKLK